MSTRAVVHFCFVLQILFLFLLLDACFCVTAFFKKDEKKKV